MYEMVVFENRRLYKNYIIERNKMTKIGQVRDIIMVKQALTELKEKKLIKEWELPFENLLTRLSAASFFIEPMVIEEIDEVWAHLKSFENFRFQENKEGKLSRLKYRVEFNEEGDN